MSPGNEYIDFQVHARTPNELGFNFLHGKDSDYPVIVTEFPSTMQVRLRTENPNVWSWWHQNKHVECTWRGAAGDDRGWLPIPHGALFIGLWPLSLIPLPDTLVEITDPVVLHTSIHYTSKVGKAFGTGEWVKLTFPAESADGRKLEPSVLVFGMNDDFGTFGDNYGVIHLDIKLGFKPESESLKFPFPQNNIIDFPASLHSKIAALRTRLIKVTD